LDYFQVLIANAVKNLQVQDLANEIPQNTPAQESNLVNQYTDQKFNINDADCMDDDMGAKNGTED
jgi:hypothetical protein